MIVERDDTLSAACGRLAFATQAKMMGMVYSRTETLRHDVSPSETIVIL